MRYSVFILKVFGHGERLKRWPVARLATCFLLAIVDNRRWMPAYKDIGANSNYSVLYPVISESK
jgi:hypothetical protein